MANLTSRLIVELIDRVSGPARTAGAAINGLTSKVRAASAANQAALSQVQGQLFGAVAAAYGLKQALTAPLKAAADFETSMLDIAQKADLSKDATKTLGEQLKVLSRQINAAAGDTAKGMDVLVGMGAKPEDALKMLGPIGKAAAAYRAEIDDLSKAGYASLDNLKVKADDIGASLGAMAKAGKEGAFELKDMARYFPTLAASASRFKMTGVAAVADIAAALQAIRKGSGTSEEAATRMGDVFQKITSDETVKKFSKLGVNIKKELATAQKAAEKAGKPFSLIEFAVDAANKALKGDKGRIGELWQDKEAQLGMLALMTHFKEYLRIRKEAEGTGGEMIDKDFEDRVQTLNARMKAFSATVNGLSIAIGDALMPSTHGLMDSLTPLIEGMTSWVKANPEVVAGTIKVVSVLIAARVAAIAARYAFTFLKAAVLGIAGPAAAVVVALASFARLAVVAAVIRPVTAALLGLRTALIGLAAVAAIGGLRAGIAALALGLVRLLNPLRLLPALLGATALAMRGLGAAMLMIPGVALLVAIGVAGTFIYNNWKGLGIFFTSFFASLKSNLESMDGGRFKVLTDAIDSVTEAWKRWTGEIGDDKSWAQSGTSAGNSVARSIRDIADAIDDVLKKWESFKSVWNKVQDVLQYNPLQAEGAGKDGALPPGQQKDRSATDARRKAFQEDRNRLGIPVIGAAKVGPSGGSGDDVWSKGTKGVDHLNQSGEAASAGQATGTAYKSALGGQLTAAEADIMAFVQRAMAALNFSVSPTITPKFGPMPSQPGLSSANAKRAQFSDGTNFG